MTRRSRVATSGLLAVSTVLVLFGFGDVTTGPAADPAITTAVTGKTPAEVEAVEPTGFRLYDFATRGAGLNLAFIGLLLASIVVGPYRAGDRWAWRTMWLLPAWSLAVPLLIVGFGPAPGTALPPPAISGPIIALLTGGALLVDRRRFVGRVPEMAKAMGAPAT